MSERTLSWKSLYRALWQVAPRVYLPLLVLQAVALATNLFANTLQGPARGATSALIPLVLDPVLTGTSLAFAYQVLRGQGDDFSAAFTTGFRTWPNLVFTSVLTVFGALAPTGWLFYFVYRRFEQAVKSNEGLLATALPFAGMLALAIPGIYIGFRLFITVPLLFAEQQTPLSSLRRSWQLLQGNWWSAATAYLPLAAVVLLIGLPLAFLLSGSPLSELLLQSNPQFAGFIVALRLAGPLGWTLYMIYCLRLLESES